MHGLLGVATVVLLISTHSLAAPVGSAAFQHAITPSNYPEKCVRRAQSIETVVIKFSTTALGEPVGLEVVETTNDCFIDAALNALVYRRFGLTGANATLAPQQGLVASLMFHRKIAVSSPELKFRRGVRRQLDRVRKSLHRGGDPKQALVRLEKIEIKYGDTYSLAEFVSHKLLCAAAFVDLGDYSSALTEVRDAKDTGLADGQIETLLISLQERAKESK